MTAGQLEEKQLKLKFHGKILDHFGIQAYQSPVAALAELVANSWDANAKKVDIHLPEGIGEKDEIIVEDIGDGMTFEECQNRYLNIGYNRRGNEPIIRDPETNRVILGRKGIGKFAGFGIASKMKIETVSKSTGEKTVFEMDLDDLRGNDFLDLNEKFLKAEYYPPEDNRKDKHGTKITLSKLTISRKISKSQFPISLARRFLLYTVSDDFIIKVDDNELPAAFESAKIEYSFPTDYTTEELQTLPDLTIDDVWGKERLSNGMEIKWRFMFYKDTIDEEELRGISIFAHEKLAQKPFFFNLTGGMTAQHGIEYLSGMVKADFVDELKGEAISTERQRINFELDETAPLLDWGQKKIKELLPRWNDRRGEERVRQISEKVAEFSSRLEALPKYERIVVEKAIKKVAAISTLTNKQFAEVGQGILSSWEKGRLKELIEAISDEEKVSEAELLNILLDSDTITALQLAEVANAQISVLTGLRERIDRNDLENAVRNYVAKNPWLISPRWETFAIEKKADSVIQTAIQKSKFEGGDYSGRIDLVLSGGKELLVVEFMRPGITVNWDHVTRFERYISEIKAQTDARTALGFKQVSGLLVADKLENNSGLLGHISDIEALNMSATDWRTMLDMAKVRWKEFAEVVEERAKDESKVKALFQQ